MKKLSIEEKAQRYDEAIKVAKRNYETIVQMDKDCTFAKEGIVNTFHHMFPELKEESEDERMKNYIISCLDNQLFTDGSQADIDRKNAIAWLEKQGEQKSVNKVELKFNVGDWVVWDNKISCHIDNIYQGKESLMYTITDVHNITRSCSVKGFDNNAHLWTIQDAKDGEVLAAHECYVIFKEIDGLNIKCYCTYHYIGFNPSFYVDTLQNKTAFYPATKKQREFLFKKMHDAGYEWDSEKKELKKIEQKQEWRKAKKVVQWLKIYFKK
jgi:hypothetical protein